MSDILTRLSEVSLHGSENSDEGQKIQMNCFLLWTLWRITKSMWTKSMWIVVLSYMFHYVLCCCNQISLKISEHQCVHMFGFFFLPKVNFILFVFRQDGREILQLFLFPWWPINFIPQVEVTSPCPLQHPTPRLIHTCYFTSKPASMSHGFITRSVDFHFLCSQLWNDTCIYIRIYMLYSSLYYLY